MHPSISSLPLTRRSFFALSGSAMASIALLATSPTFAEATTWSSPRSTTLNGVTYSYSSGIDGGSRPKAYTRISASKSVSAGTMRARALLIKKLDENIYAASAWLSNSVGSTLTATVTASAALELRSKGQVKINGRNYSCTSTPVVQSHPDELPRNTREETYGTYLDVEHGRIPDLIAIVADNGTEGYARYEQFIDENTSESIPVYDVEGIAMVGMFTFGDK